VEKAINFEIERQIDVIEGGGEVIQETRLYDPDKDETRSMRSKEEAMDYRYFPDPDLLPVVISEETIEAIKSELPELPADKKARFENELGLSSYDAGILTSDRELADYFEQVASVGGEAKLAANWVIGDLSGRLNKEDKQLSECPVTAEMLGGMIKRLAENAITSKMAKEVFDAMWNGEGDADIIIEKRGLKPADSGEVEKIIDEVIASNPEQVGQFRAGKTKMMGFFVGQVMKASKGKADPAQVNKLLTDKLK
jgi:aspartyl-tRNA(Asn)/glutamyl-tRNA(Gln) amidotransferase subunit B